MASEIEICNMALSFVGDSATVAGIEPDEEGAQAQLCKLLYEPALKYTLQQHAWTFATATRRATGVSSIYGPKAFMYELPPDVVAVRSVQPYPTYDEREVLSNYQAGFKLIGTIDYEVGLSTGASGEHKRVLYADVPNVLIKYTTANANPEYFSPSFALAVAWRLASLIAGQRLGGESGMKVQRQIQRQADVMLAQARNDDSKQRQGNGTFIPSWIEVR